MKVRFGLFMVTLASLGACSDQPITGVRSLESSKAIGASLAIVAQASQTICSGAGNGWVAIAKNPVWADPVGASTYVGRTANSATDYTRLAQDDYVASFSVPTGATNIAITGNVSADNDVTIRVGAGTPFFDTGAGGYPAGTPDNSTFPNFTTDGGLPFGTSAGLATGPNTVTFRVYNDDNPNTAEAGYNPSGLSFCFTVTYDEEVPGGQGCSPGYWKNHNFPLNISKSALFNSDIVGTDFENAFAGQTFQQVLEGKGGGLTALGRATVSAYFNAVALGTNYELTAAQVVQKFNDVYPGTDASYNTLKAEFEALQDVFPRICPNPTGK